MLPGVLLHSQPGPAHLSSMPATPAPITTIEELLSLPDDGLRHELLDGVHVVSPVPRPAHQSVFGELFYALKTTLRGRIDIDVFASPADIILGPKVLVQPDIFIVARPGGGRIERWQDAGVPLLAIEILSPSTAARDRGAKRHIYQRAGVREYWIVDADSRLVERWKPGEERPEIVTETLSWALPGGAQGVIDLNDVFGAA
jgi:Uma2 family endonuclease